MEVMTAYRFRRPPSPPDRRPPRRGGGSSPSPYACASAAGRAAGPARPRLAPRGLLRSARALAAAALLALSGALALPATAQADVLVSNIGQSTETAGTLDVTAADQSLQFTTGGTTGDSHNLDSVEVSMDTFFGAEMAVSLYSDASGVPGSSLFTFTNPTGGVTSGAVNTFTAPANTTLTGGTPYHIVVSSPSVGGSFVQVKLDRTTSNAEDDAGEDDWEIGNNGYSLSGTTWSSSTYKMQIRVNGTAAGGTPTCTLNTGDLWCGVVTVAAISSGGSVAAHGFAGADGDLDDKTFSVGTNNYTIDGLYVGTAGDLNLDLTGALDAADKGNLKLVVGSTDFDLDDATHVSSENAYLWTGTGLNWSSDAHVTLRMRRAVALSTDATLSGLTVYDGSSNLTLSPSFASGTEAYTASAAYDIATVTVTANKNQADATVAWLDASDATLADADAMASGHQVALAAGGNTFKVKVTAEDGTTTKTYTVTVNRASPSCTLNTGDLWCGVVTVGNGAGFDGYAASVSLGALSDRTFSVGTNNYTIDAIYVEIGGFNPERLTFNLASGLTSADRAALVLHLGSVEFEFSDANVAAGLSYKWSDTGLNWSSESFVTLRLRDTPVTMPTLSIADAEATEGDDMEFTVTLSAADAAVVTATWTATIGSGDTAVAADLGTTKTGTVTVSIGNTTGTFEVSTVEDSLDEDDETFTVTLSNVSSNATLGTATATGTINNDDAPAAPTNFAAAVGNAQVVLSWDAPDSGSGVTRHEYQYKEGTGSYPANFTPIPNSGEGGTNEAGYTVTGLTNETAYTFELRAVAGAINGAAAEADPVTPTPGICGRTQKVHEGIVYYLEQGGVERTCAEVNVADLESFTAFLEMPNEGIASLKTGDFAGLTNVTRLGLGRNSFTTLPANVFSGLTSLEVLELSAGDLISLDARAFSGLSSLEQVNLGVNELSSLPANVFSGLSSLTSLILDQNELSWLPANVFSGLSALEEIRLGDNDLTALPAGVFSGLTALKDLKLEDNNLTSLDARQFSGLTTLEEITLNGNALTALPAGLLAGLTSLEKLGLRDNDLTSLPDGLFSGLTGLTTLALGDNPNTGDTLALTVTVEKFGTDQARAKVLAGAPFAVDFTATVVNGSLPTGVTKLAVAQGSVDGTAVTVTRTTGTMAAVTVDLDLSTQPSLPTNHQGYEFVKADSGLPAEILPAVGMTPTIDDVDITSTPVLETDTYGAGEKIRLTVEFSEAVTVTGQPHIEFSLGNMSDTRRVKALYESGSGADELVFAYTVVSSDEDNNGIFTHPDALMVESGESIVSAGGVNADLDHAGDGTDSGHKVDGSRSIVSVAVSSTPMLETDTYGAGETIRFKVTFNVAVDVTGDPVFGFALGNMSDTRDVDAAYEGGSGTTALVFGYTVASTDEDNNGIYLKDEQDFNTPDGPVRLDSDDTIRFAGTSTDVPLYWQGRGTQSGHKVDGSLTSSNSAPSFTSSATFDAAENQTSAGTVEAEDSDTEDNIEGYEIAGGADSDFFSEVTSAGVLTFNEAPNFEDPQDQDGDNTYEVTVQATSGTGTREMTATQTITVTVTDAGGEAPGKPDAPTVSAASATSLTATWLAPANAGPAIDDYDVQYREGATGDWSNGGHTGAATTATLSGLSENTSYQVQVRATNDEGTGSWSDSGSGATNAETPDAPTITAVAVTSTPQLETDTYGEDETIEVSVTFSEAVNATSDTDFVLSVSGDKRAPLVRGSGTTTLAFGYTVASSDDDDNGIWIGDQDRTLAGDRNGNPQNGAITSVATSTAADLAHAELGQLSGHKVDGSRTPTPDDDPLNNDPVFTEGDSATREVANGRSPATKIGQPVTATDADNDELVYDLEGDDRSLFIITENSAQILTWPVPGVVDYSGRNSYQVTVKARDGKGGSDAIDVTINFTDSDDEDDGPPEDDDEDDGPPEDDDEDDGPPEDDDEDDGPPEDDDDDDGPPEDDEDDGPPETPTTPVAPPVPHTTTPARLRIRALDADADSMSLHMSWRAPEANAAAVTGYRFRVFEGPATRRVWPPVVDWTPVPEPLYEQNGRYEHTVRLSVASAYTVWLRAALTNGFSDHAQADIFYFHPVGAESEERPERVALIGNYPNPFNPSTEIVYELPGPGPVRLVVYDMIGREVQVLADAHRTAGRHTARFDAEGLPTGTYAYTLTAGSVAITRVMVLVR